MSVPFTHSKTRIAPTPSGFLHLGNAYSFLITSQLARKTGADIVLRIDDLDRERVSEEYVQDIFETLNFLNIKWKEGPSDLIDFEKNFSQMHRLALYETALQQLRDKKLLYACSCSRQEILNANPDGIYTGTCRNKKIPLDTENVCWRLDTSSAGSIKFKTSEGWYSKEFPVEMHDFIVRKKDSYPSYQLSSLVDDLHFNIDLIVRGEDLLASSIAQLFLAEQLGEKKFLQTTFHHHPLLKDSMQRKLSKSEGDTSLRFLRKTGVSLSEVYQLTGLQDQITF